jgi:hypothetical protein
VGETSPFYKLVKGKRKKKHCFFFNKTMIAGRKRG